MGRRNKRYRRLSYDRPRKKADFRKAEKDPAPVEPSVGFGVVGVDRVTVGSYKRKVTGVYSVMRNLNAERAGRMFTFHHRLGFGKSRLPQNLGRGQKKCPDRNILGRRSRHRES